MSNFYISDVHGFHKNVVAEGKNFDGRPFQTLDEMHEEMLKRWNERVTNADTVFILGDMLWRVNDESIAWVAKMRANKVLICGNHDVCKDRRYTQLFTEICDYKEITDNINGINYNLVLSHYPILMWNGQHRGRILLYGHVHNTIEEAYFQQCIAGMNSPEFKGYHAGDQEIKAYNVGAMLDYMDYTPRTLKEIIDANRIEM